MISVEEGLKHLNEWLLDIRDREEEKKINPAWKKLRPNGDALNRRLPGSYGG